MYFNVGSHCGFHNPPLDSNILERPPEQDPLLETSTHSHPDPCETMPVQNIISIGFEHQQHQWSLALGGSRVECVEVKRPRSTKLRITCVAFDSRSDSDKLKAVGGYRLWPGCHWSAFLPRLNPKPSAANLKP